MRVSNSSLISDDEVSEQLQQLEEKRDLLRYTVDGWSAWPMLRSSVAGAMQSLPMDRNSVGFSKKELLPIALNDLGQFLCARRAHFVVKTLGSYHSELEHGLKKDIFFDDLLRKVGHFFKVEVVNKRSFQLNAVPNLIRRDLSTVALNILESRLARQRPVRGLEKTCTQISECLDTELGLNITSKHIWSILSSFHWSRRLYRAVLKRVQPRVLLLADIADYPATAAARELGIRVVEFQHGIVHRSHPATSWSRYALSYKKVMAVPDRILLFGPYWKREMEVNGFWAEELRAVGSVRVDEYRRRLPTKSGDLCTMVVTTQGIDTERLIAFFVEFIRLAQGRLDFRLIFKMHPVYQTTDHLFTTAFSNNSSVELVPAAQRPTTFELLKQAHLHLSIYSTCHYEALALRVPTVILPLSGAKWVLNLYHSGEAFHPGTPAELLELAIRWRELSVPGEAGDRYFTPGALENIESELGALSQRDLAVTQ